MQNIVHRIVGTKLVLEIDISPAMLAAATPSKSGKTRLLATTGGAQSIPGVSGGSFSINVMVPR